MILSPRFSHLSLIPPQSGPYSLGPGRLHEKQQAAQAGKFFFPEVIRVEFVKVPLENGEADVALRYEGEDGLYHPYHFQPKLGLNKPMADRAMLLVHDLMRHIRYGLLTTPAGEKATADVVRASSTVPFGADHHECILDDAAAAKVASKFGKLPQTILRQLIRLLWDRAFPFGTKIQVAIEIPFPDRHVVYVSSQAITDFPLKGSPQEQSGFAAQHACPPEKMFPCSVSEHFQSVIAEFGKPVPDALKRYQQLLTDLSYIRSTIRLPYKASYYWAEIFTKKYTFQSESLFGRPLPVCDARHQYQFIFDSRPDFQKSEISLSQLISARTFFVPLDVTTSKQLASYDEYLMLSRIVDGQLIYRGMGTLFDFRNRFVRAYSVLTPKGETKLYHFFYAQENGRPLHPLEFAETACDQSPGIALAVYNQNVPYQETKLRNLSLAFPEGTVAILSRRGKFLRDLFERYAAQYAHGFALQEHIKMQLMQQRVMPLPLDKALRKRLEAENVPIVNSLGPDDTRHQLLVWDHRQGLEITSPATVPLAQVCTVLPPQEIFSAVENLPGANNPVAETLLMRLFGGFKELLGEFFSRWGFG